MDVHVFHAFVDELSKHGSVLAVLSDKDKALLATGAVLGAGVLHGTKRLIDDVRAGEQVRRNNQLYGNGGFY